jgi:hypothetical protein
MPPIQNDIVQGIWEEENMANEKQRRAFISYSRANKEFATKLVKGLRAGGYPVWFDLLDIPTGARWDDEVEKALRECSIFMIILTPASIASENVKDEIGYAIDHGKRILPVLLEECDVPLRLRRFQYVDFTTKSFDEGFESAKELLSDLIEEVSTPIPSKAPAVEVSGKARLEPVQVKPVSATTPQKKSIPMGLVIGIVAVAVLVIAGIGIGLNAFSNRGTPATKAPIVDITATEAPAIAQTATEVSVVAQPATETQGVPTPVTGNILLQDDFSDSSIWETWADSDSSAEYVNGALNMNIFTKDLLNWTTPNNGNSYQNIHMEVTTMTNDSDPTAGFALMCNLQSDGHSYYYLIIKSTGEYAIARAVAGPNDVFLTNNDEWATSDLITRNASSYRLGADCGSDGTLTLYVDGQKIDSVSDSTYGPGRAGLLIWSDSDATKTDITFDDFMMTTLK